MEPIIEPIVETIEEKDEKPVGPATIVQDDPIDVFPAEEEPTQENS